MARLAAWGRWLAARRGPFWLVAAAFTLVASMYAWNDDMGGDPRSPRGDGVYRPVLARGDGHMSYLIARSTALDFDWDFDNDLGRFGDPWRQPKGANGHKVIPQPIGAPLVWTPLIWLAEGAAWLLDQLGADIPLHGYTPWHQRFVFASSTAAALFAIALGIAMARRLLGARWAPAYAGVAILLGTALTYYATFMPSYGHALDAGVCAAFLAYWAKTSGTWRWRRFIVLGLLLGLAMLIRVQDLSLGIVVAIEAVALAVRNVRERFPWHAVVAPLAGGAIVLAIALVCFIPQLIYWKIVYGGAFAMPQGGAYTRPGSPMILELLFSARNGWLSSHPLNYLGVIGLFLLPRRVRLVAAGLVAAVAIQVYLNSTIFDWWGTASFGNRRLCSVTLPVVVGLATLVWRMGRLVARVRVPRVVWHALVVAIFGVFVAWNIGRTFQHAHGLAAPDGHSPTCCDRVPAAVRGPARWIYERFGNPFEFPASAIFAVRHGVELWRWDRVVGNYPVTPGFLYLAENRLAGQRGAWHLGHPGGEPYLIGAWSRSQGSPPYRWTMSDGAVALVPNVVPTKQRLTVHLAPGGTPDVTLTWDGDVVSIAHLAPGWSTVTFEVDASVGEHELGFQCTPAPFGGAPGFAASTQPVGVAVGDVEVELQ